jgi:hypothetical protein
MLLSLHDKNPKKQTEELLKHYWASRRIFDCFRGSVVLFFEAGAHISVGG